MDPATKERFKWKFYRLAVLLNLIILLVAIGVIAFFKAPPDYRIPAFAILVLVAAILGIYFQRRYQQTKTWLEEQG
jgi:membrane protein implicated in regulation of membrane protease activity